MLMTGRIFFAGFLIAGLSACECGRPAASVSTGSDTAVPPAASGSDEAVVPPAIAADPAPKKPGTTIPEGERGKDVRVKDVKVGGGAMATIGREVTLHYVIKLWEGGQVVVDSHSFDHPLAIELGKGQLMTAAERGMVGMRKEGRRVIFVPAIMAYGAAGSGPIPPNADLLVEVEMLDVR